MSPNTSRRRPLPRNQSSPSGHSSHADETPAPGPAVEVFYTPAQAAEILLVKESWLRHKAGQRKIPCHKIGKHLRFSAMDVALIMAAGAQPTAPNHLC